MHVFSYLSSHEKTVNISPSDIICFKKNTFLIIVTASCICETLTNMHRVESGTVQVICLNQLYSNELSCRSLKHRRYF